MLRNISFDLVHYFTYKNMKSQLLAVKKAEWKKQFPVGAASSMDKWMDGKMDEKKDRQE